VRDEFQTLRKTIESLSDAAGDVRARLLNCLDAAARRPADALGLARGVAESLTKQIVTAIGVKPPAVLDACLKELERPETMSRGLVPGEIVTILHKVRTIGNKALHDDLRIRVTAEDVTNVLGDVLRVVRWYFAEFVRGPGVDPFAPEARPGEAAPSARLVVLMFTDLVDSAGLARQLGDAEYVRQILEPHNALFRRLLARFPAAREVKHTGDGFMATFASASDAARCALEFDHALRTTTWPRVAPRVRIGIHVGEAIDVPGPDGTRQDLAGDAANMAARLTALAAPGQVLLTKAAFDGARQSGLVVAPGPDSETGPTAPRGQTCWMVHGRYRFQGAEEPFEVGEVGIVGVSRLQPPDDSEKARRVVSEEEALLLGWRPGPGIEIPRREQWFLDRKLGEGGFGEVWLARHRRTKESRVFKFCFDPDRLRSFKRELTIFRLIKQHLGERADVARLYDVQMDQPPFFLESEYVPGGNLEQWSDDHGGLTAFSLEFRLRLLARIARAVAVAHSLGIIHKDLKPSNVLIVDAPDADADRDTADADGPDVRPRLCDFGIGVVTDRSLLARHQITDRGFTESLLAGNESSRTGTRLYAPPESQLGRPATTAGDVYALGVMLYQLVTGDLTRPLGTGWEEDVADELLRADIQACTLRDPARRLASAADLADRLAGLNARAAELRFRKRGERTARRLRQARGIAMALAAGLIVAAYYGVVAHRRAEALNIETRRADANAADANRRKESLRRGQYARAVNLGQQLWEQGDLPRTRTVLAELRPKDGEPDVRGFEWHYLWRLAQTGPRLVLRRHRATVTSLAYSPDGKLLAGAGDDGRIVVWGYPGGTVRWEAPPEASAATRSEAPAHVAFSADGRRLVAGRGRHADLRSADTGRVEAKIDVPDGEIGKVAVSADNQQVLLGAFRGESPAVYFWEFGSNRILRRQQYAGLAIRSMAFGNDNAVVAFGGGGIVRVFDTITGHARLDFRAPFEGSDITGLAVSPDGATVAAVSVGGHLGVFDLEDGRPRCVTRAHTGTAYDVGIAADGSYIATAGYDGLVKIWDGATGMSRNLLRADFGALHCLALAPDLVSLTAGAGGGEVVGWQVRDNPAVDNLPATAGYVRAVGFIPNSHQLVSVGGDRADPDDRRRAEVDRWDVDRPADPDGFQEFHPRVGQWVQLARDEKSLVVVEDAGLAVWDVPGRRVRFRVVRPPHSQSAVVLSPDGRWLAVGNQSSGTTEAIELNMEAPHCVQLYDVTTGRLRASLEGHAGAVGIGFSADGLMLATRGVGDGLVRLWDLSPLGAGGRPVPTGVLEAEKGCGLRVVFSPDGEWLCAPNVPLTSQANLGRALLWKVRDRRRVATLPDVNDCVAFSPDGRYLLAGTGRGYIAEKGGIHGVGVWELTADGTGQIEVRPWAHWGGLDFAVDMIQFLPDGHSLVSWEAGVRTRQELEFGQSHIEVHRWDLREREAKPRPAFAADTPAGWNQLSADGRTLVTATTDGDIGLCAVETGNGDAPWAVRPAAVLRSFDGKAFSGHRNDVTCVAVSPDGRTIATGSSDRTVKLWDASTKQVRATLRGHAQPVHAVAFSPDGTTLASGGGPQPWPTEPGPGEIMLWNAGTGEKIRALDPRPAAVLCLAFSPDGRSLAGGESVHLGRGDGEPATPGELRLWDVATGAVRSVFQPPADERSGRRVVFGVAFSPGGARLASVESGSRLRVWDVESGALAINRVGDRRSLRCISYSPDGKTLATGGDDHTVRLWQAETGDELLTLQGHSRRVFSVAFSSDGRVLAGSSFPGGVGVPSIYLWRAGD
jgi:WD40 repeat protein/class 3 adenylate cyclase